MYLFTRSVYFKLHPNKTFFIVIARLYALTSAFAILSGVSACTGRPVSSMVNEKLSASPCRAYGVLTVNTSFIFSSESTVSAFFIRALPRCPVALLSFLFSCMVAMITILCFLAIVCKRSATALVSFRSFGSSQKSLITSTASTSQLVSAASISNISQRSGTDNSAR